MILSRTQVKEDMLALSEQLLEKVLPKEGDWKGRRMCDLESQVYAVGQTLTRTLLEKIIAAHPRTNPEDLPGCPHCDKPLRIQEREQVRALKTSLGPIIYRRAYGTCDFCRISGAPLDWVLGIPPTGSSVSYRQQVADACTVGRSFEIGKKILRDHDRLSLSRKAAWRISLQEGRQLVEKRTEQVSAAFHIAKDQPSRLVPRDALKLLVITCDGGRVQTLAQEKQERWKEDRIGAVYDALPRPQPHAARGDYKGAKAVTTTFVATMENWETFGPMLYTEAHHRGYAQAEKKVFLSDGAEAIRSLRELQFPEAIPILDWCHASLSAHRGRDISELTGGDFLNAGLVESMRRYFQ